MLAHLLPHLEPVRREQRPAVRRARGTHRGGYQDRSYIDSSRSAGGAGVGVEGETPGRVRRDRNFLLPPPPPVGSQDQRRWQAGQGAEIGEGGDTHGEHRFDGDGGEGLGRQGGTCQDRIDAAGLYAGGREDRIVEEGRQALAADRMGTDREGQQDRDRGAVGGSWFWVADWQRKKRSRPFGLEDARERGLGVSARSACLQAEEGRTEFGEWRMSLTRIL
mmetsp:Transcript_33042/g.60909  ORF Transcript_33042/g.60909 Transcript_33042/m.60909 type:complete len:220 (+) Transcript_33042:742-1401(+)